MAISLIPGKKEKKLGLGFKGLKLGISFRFHKGVIAGAVLLTLVLIFYLGSSVWVGQQQIKIEDIKEEKEMLFSSANSSEIAEVRLFARRIRALQDIIDDHVYTSNIFEEIEMSTHKNTSFTAFELNVEMATIKLSGISTSFDSLAEQFVLWNDESDYVRSVTLEDFEKNSNGLIEFDAILLVNKSFFKKAL